MSTGGPIEGCEFTQHAKVLRCDKQNVEGCSGRYRGEQGDAAGGFGNDAVGFGIARLHQKAFGQTQAVTRVKNIACMVASLQAPLRIWPCSIEALQVGNCAGTGVLVVAVQGMGRILLDMFDARQTHQAPDFARDDCQRSEPRNAGNAERQPAPCGRTGKKVFNQPGDGETGPA